MDEFRRLLKALGFKWGNLHSSYYVKISQRDDVVAHRSQLIPVLRLVRTDDRFFYVNTDWSHIYENAHSNSGWISMVKEGSDLVDVNPGKGRRINVCEFITREGILFHPDGSSAGSLFPPSATLNADNILTCIQRGIEAIIAHPEVAQKKRIAVLHIDGARVNMTFPPDVINPKNMNLSDGGKNRQHMRHIGKSGLKSVLLENGRWKHGMTVNEARSDLWQWSLVRQQLNRVEELCRQHNIVCIYKSKSHPWLCMIEKFWRLAKYQLQDLGNVIDIRNKYQEIVESMRYGKQLAKTKCVKWWQRVSLFVEYYSRGGSKFVHDSEVPTLDLPSYGHLGPRYKYTSADRIFADSHRLNWIVRQGKRYDPI